MRLNDGEVEKRRRQVKIINNLMNINCPRSNSNAVVVMRRSPPAGPWFGTEALGTIRIIRRKSRRNWLSGFFQAQLRMMKQGKLSSTKIIVIKKKKKKKKKGKLSSFTKSVDNQIIASKSLVNYQFGGTCPILKRHRRRRDVIDLKKDRLSDLPKELLAQILVRLPVKYILRCSNPKQSLKEEVMFWRKGSKREINELNVVLPCGQVRVLVVGDSGAGKTSLVHLITKGSSYSSPPQTIGCNVGVKHTTYGTSSSSSNSIGTSSSSSNSIKGDAERLFC